MNRWDKSTAGFLLSEARFIHLWNLSRLSQKHNSSLEQTVNQLIPMLRFGRHTKQLLAGGSLVLLQIRKKTRAKKLNDFTKKLSDLEAAHKANPKDDQLYTEMLKPELKVKDL